MQLFAHIRRKTKPTAAGPWTECDGTLAQPPLVRGETERERRTAALDAITTDPGLRQFYERVIPADIEPVAWLPFWPSAWRGLQAGATDHDLR